MDELEQLEQEMRELKNKLHQLELRKQRLLNSNSSNNLSPSDKISLFLSYFKGNPNCYANRWQNNQSRSGYSIACHNEWQQGICNKPKIKCLECPNQAFKIYSDDAIYAHLTGKQVIGIYPMLENNTTRILAIDFDKNDWQDASLAYTKACKENQIDCLLERSRSGNGAHVWIFFEQAVDAKIARELGFYLLDQAMKIHGTLSFDSYDRLFPNQDILPKGGIGNLIALPLQKQARSMGNSIFVDESFAAYPDQWSALAAVKRLSSQEIEKIVKKQSSKENESEHNSLVKPWERHKKEKIPEIYTKEMDLVIANRIYFSVSQLPNFLIARFKKMASFSNPKFFKAQALRLSTNGISRFVCLAELDNGYLSLPRGCLDDIEQICLELGITINIDDRRTQGSKLTNISFKGSLRADQKKAIQQMHNFEQGVLHAPTAFGKTITAIGMICKRKVNTLVLVHNRQLVEQWIERLKAFIEGVDIGIFTGTKKKPTKQIDIATYQSLINKNDNSVNPMVHEYGQIVVDECHHLSAPKYDHLLSEIHAKYLFGISATLERRDGHHPIIFMLAGKVRHSIKSNQNNQFIQTLVKINLQLDTPSHLATDDPRPHISEVYQWLTNHLKRNKAIVKNIKDEVAQGRVPLVLTERREHANIIADLLHAEGIEHQVLLGSMNKKQQIEVMDKIQTTQVLIATGRIIGEGFDLPRLDTLILALPVSWKGSLIQYVGRIQRQYEGKTEIKVMDYVDENIPMLVRMFKKRLKGYSALGFSIEN